MSAVERPRARRDEGLIDAVDELDRLEREALGRDDWVALEQVLERQKRLWQCLARLARHGEDETTCAEALQALGRLYQTRMHNHPVIERRTEELRVRLIETGRIPAAEHASPRSDRQAA